MAPVTVSDNSIDLSGQSDSDVETSDDESFADAVNDNQQPFRLMDLPPELKLRVWRMALPVRSRIALDPKNIRNPGPFVGTRYSNPNIIPLLLVSKAVYNDVIAMLYSANVFCLIEPSANDNALGFIGTLAMKNMKKLEVRVKHGLIDLGAIWEDLTDHCLKMKELKLIFYHEKNQWLDMVADLALLPEPKPKLDLQLYSSIWSEQNGSAAAVRTKIDKAFVLAERRKNVMRYNVLPKVGLITVAASVSGDTAYAFLTYQRNGQTAFEAKMDRESELPPRTCLRWKV